MLSYIIVMLLYSHIKALPNMLFNEVIKKKSAHLYKKDIKADL